MTTTPYFAPSYFCPGFFGSLGSVSPPAPDRPVWTTYDWMKRVAPPAVGLRSKVGSDDPDYLALRQDVTARLLGAWAAAYGPLPGFFRRQLAVPDPVFGFEVPDPTVPVPTPAQFRTALGSGGLVVDDPLAEAVAQLAVAEVYGRQTRDNLDREAADLRAAATATLRQHWPRVTVAGSLYRVAPSGLAITLLPS